MVSDDNPIKSMLHRQDRVFRSLDTFRNDRQFGRFPQPLDIVPIERVINIRAHGAT
jgi:hypothetical protein